MASSSPLLVKLRPSDAHRWMRCKASPGYIATNQDRIPVQSTRYSDEGGLAHEYAKALLTNEPWTGEAIEPEMHDHVVGYVNFVRAMHQKVPGRRLIVESKFPLFYLPNGTGIVDAAICDPTSLHIVDLKYGEGVSVEAVGNEQLAIYFANVAKGANLDVSKLVNVSMTIYQPRARDNRYVRRWEPTAVELDTLLYQISETAQEIQMLPLDQMFCPEDSTCQFCPAKSFCEARAGELLSELPEVVEDVTVVDAATVEASLPDPKSLSLEQAAKVFLVKRSLISWLEDVEDYLLAIHATGQKIPGTKVVLGKGGHRAWTDEDAAFKVLKRFVDRTKLLETKLVSPAKAEKLLKSAESPITARSQNKLDALITKPGGSPTLVSESDPRDAIDMSLIGIEDLNENDSLI